MGISSAGRRARSRRSCSRSSPGRSSRAAISSCSCTCSRPARLKTVLAGDRFLFHRSRAARDADDPAARLAGHRHSAGRAALRDSRFVRAAGRRAAAGDPAARALPRQGDPRHRDAARRHRSRAGDAHRRLGLPLAACLPREYADPAAEGHAPVDGIHLRQLGRRTPQSRAAAGARVLGPALARRDGRPVVSAARRRTTPIARG